MKINFRIIAALLVIVAVVYFAFDAVQSSSYSGSELTFSGSKIVTVENPSDEPVAFRATSSRSFTIASTNPARRSITSTREGTGRDAVYVAEAELPSGTTTLTISRGTDITYALEGDQVLSVTAAPRTSQDNRTILIIAGVVILGLLFYISNTTEHAWLKAVRSRGTAGQTGSIPATGSS